MRPFFRATAKRRRVAPFFLLAALPLVTSSSHAADRIAEHITLKNGFDLICDHREQAGDRVRLFTDPGSASFVEVAATEVALVEPVTIPVADAVVTAKPSEPPPVPSAKAELTKAELHEMLAAAGAQHNLDVNLLASVVRAESGGHSRAVSRAGAQGLMQLMPKTAAQLGVSDSFRPEENIAGGTAYLDSLLTRYHDNLALALAAYNAGPAAVDRWHEVPPYRETRLYVARIIRDFNASVKAARQANLSKSSVASASASPSLVAGAAAP